MTAVFPASATFSGPRLVAVGGVPVTELAARFGTPLYVLDRAELVGRMRAYRRAFGDEVAVTYAAKALCVTGVLQLAAAEGLHLDVASAGELHTAARAAFPMERVLFHGNNKSDDELEMAARLGVGRIAVDSFTELARLSAVGQRRGHTFPVLLRVTPGVLAETHAFVATGQDDVKFGFTLRAGLAHEAAARALTLPCLELVGAHCHLGSQISAEGGFSAAVALLVGFLADIRDRHGVVLDELNVGGGLGIAYTADDVTLPLDRYAATLHGAVRRETARRRLPEPRLAVEPGRSIAGPAGVTLYTVGTVKEVPGVRVYASVDGGMSDNLRPALYGARYTVVAAGPGSTTAALRPVTVAGKHCETGDILVRDAPLPADLAEGGLLAVAATGAYGHAMGSNYNRLTRPAMVLVDGGRVAELVHRETLDHVVARDVVLNDEQI